MESTETKPTEVAAAKVVTVKVPFAFPELGISVEAATLDEAIKLVERKK